jgi:hypothetical protein
MLRKILAAAVLAATALEANASLTTGDIAFTSFNADEDGWSLVTFVDIAANTSIFFSDNAWNGTSFSTSESFHTWNSGAAAIGAGSVIRFSAIDAAGRSASIGTLTGAGSNFGMNATSETIFAYLGSNISTPTTFLTGVSSEGTASLSTAGLVAGVNAVVLTNSTDYAEFTGIRTGAAAFGDYRAVVNNAANWNILVGGAQEGKVPNTASFSVIPAAVPLPAAGWMFLSVTGLFGCLSRRRTVQIA